MSKDRSQLINAIFIFTGGGVLVFELINGEKNPYLLILGLVLLMFGLYRATNHWSYTKDDHKKKLDEDEVAPRKDLE